MLVLTRKLRDQIKIGNDITLTVLKVKGNSIRIGIDAPMDVHILRGELPTFDDEPDPPDPKVESEQDVGDKDEPDVVAIEPPLDRFIPRKSA